MVICDEMQGTRLHRRPVFFIFFGVTYYLIYSSRDSTTALDKLRFLGHYSLDWLDDHHDLVLSSRLGLQQVRYHGWVKVEEDSVSTACVPHEHWNIPHHPKSFAKTLIDYTSLLEGRQQYTQILGDTNRCDVVIKATFAFRIFESSLKSELKLILVTRSRG